MASKHSFLIFLVLIIGVPSSSAREKHMVFYLHETVTGSDITAKAVAGVNGWSASELAFGTVIVTDDVLTEGANITSPHLGRAKGKYEIADVKVGCAHMDFTMYFENKLYNGSTLEILGTDSFSNGTPSEVAVVGGTRKFRYARGYATMKIVSHEGSNVVIMFNVTYRLD